MSVMTLLVGLVLFQVKHYLADFHWQTPWMLLNKGLYGHPGGLAHAGLHGLLTLPVLVVIAPVMPVLFALLILAEIAVHYHLDWIKARQMTQRGIHENNPVFWRLLGLDQAAHQLTYIAIIGALVTFGP